MRKVFTVLAVLVSFQLSIGQAIFINEFHYDNTGGDTGEFVEVAVQTTYSGALDAIDVVHYNGSGGVVIQSRDLSQAAEGMTSQGFTFYVVTYSVGIQNDVEAFALVVDGTVVEFISYEGTLTATAGPANGLTSVDIGVEESGTTPIGFSLQRTGSCNGSTCPTGLSWTAPADDSPGDVNSSETLPISLSSFTAKAQTNDILLNWQTATEVNNDYMAVERSRDGRHFEEIGMVQGMGTTTEAQDYEFIDRNPLRGMNFYRLRQVDFDGQFEYHKVVAVDFGKGEMVSDFDIYPTVVQHELTVSSGAEIEDNTIVQIIGMDGSIWRKPLLLTNGSLDVSDLPAGIYLLQLQTNGSISSKRFVKE